jgi:hypothetical protein
MKTFVITLMIYLAASVNAQPPSIQWTHVYVDSSTDEYVFMLGEAADHGFIMTGFSSPYDNPNGRTGFVRKTDSSGAEQWCKYFNYGGWLMLDDGICTTDGGSLLVGSNGQFGNAIIIKLNSVGDTLWTHRYLDIDIQGTQKIFQMDGGFAIAGTARCSEGQICAFVMRVDNAGNRTWIRYHTWGPNSIVELSDAKHILNTGFALLCDYAPDLTNPLARNLLLIRTNEQGDTSWTRVYSRPEGMIEPNAIDVTPDHNIYICAGISSDLNWDGYIMKLNIDGRFVWDRVLSNPNIASPITVLGLPDNGILVAMTRTLGYDRTDLLRYNSEGDTLWTKIVGPEQGSCATLTMCTTANLGYGIGGYVSQSSFDAFAVRLGRDSSLNAPDYPVSLPQTFHLTAFPNPFNSTTTLKFSLPNFANAVELTVFDVLGREVLRRDLHPQTSSFEYHLDASTWGSGVYFISAAAKGQHVMEKVLLLK